MFKKIIFAFSLMLISVYMSAENDNVHIDFSKISQGSHPRLMMNENSFDKLKEKLAVSAKWQLSMMVLSGSWKMK